MLVARLYELLVGRHSRIWVRQIKLIGKVVLGAHGLRELALDEDTTGRHVAFGRC